MRLGVARTWTAGVALVISLAVAAMLVSTPAVGAAVNTCRVTNTTTHVTLTALQNAIGAAAAGRTLSITGTCVGNFKIAKNLVLKKGATAAVLMGHGGRTLTVAAGKTVTLKGLVITGGKAMTCAEYGGRGCGGAIYNNGSLTLDGSTVRGNHAGNVMAPVPPVAFGGGIYNAPSGTLTLMRSTVSGNLAQGPAGAGGGIFNDGTLTIRASTISGNTASGAPTAEGGGIFNDGGGTTLAGHPIVGVLTVVNSTIQGNRATGTGFAVGGGIFNNNPAASMISSTVSGNSLTSGGTTMGGGIATFAGPFAVRSSIIAGNHAPVAPDCSGTFISGGDNLIGIGNDCPGIANGTHHDHVGSIATPLDPKLGPLAANGGPTRTLALLAGSPALNAAAVPCATGRDQRGLLRPRGGACDIGAFEK